MPKIFAITSANDTIKLNADRHAEAVFTVTDTIARPLRGLAKLKPLGDTKQEWLKLKGESERDFVAGGTQQYTVMLDVPADTAPGKYGFRLDIVSTINPDEDFTEGPTVTAELAPPKPRPPSKAWMIPVALIVLAVIVGAIVFLATRKKSDAETSDTTQTTVTVPTVEGQKVEQARDLLAKAQLEVTETQVRTTNPTQVGTVKSSNPKSGETVALKSPVALEVYVPDKVIVRSVLGSTPEQARQILEGEQFLHVTTAKAPMASNEYHRGQVAGQSPAAGTTVEPGAEITLTLAGTQEDVLAAKGEALAAADPLATALRNKEPEDSSRRGFDIGMAIAEKDTLPGPGKDKLRDSLSAPERIGFQHAVDFSLERNRNADLARKGGSIAKQDQTVAEARSRQPTGLAWLGFDIATGIFGDPKLGALGHTATGPGSQQIKDALSPDAQQGFEASVVFHLNRKYDH
jgi:hypothetical protein